MAQEDDFGWICPLTDASSSMYQQIGLPSPRSSVPSRETTPVPDPLESSLSSILSDTPSKKRKLTKSFPPMTEIVSWPELLRQYEVLLKSRESMSSRRFNKTALDLLNACINFVKKKSLTTEEKVEPASPLGSLDNILADQDWMDQKAALGALCAELLSKKETQTDDLVQRVVNFIHQILPPHLTADEKRETLLRKSSAFMQELSPALAIKAAPVLKSYVAQLFDSHMDQMFAEISIPEMDIKEKTLLYRRMLTNFIDNENCVSFMTSNRPLLGKVKAKDIWFLTFFACVTARRVRGDNLLQLGCCGRSSVGKSLLFESIILLSAHQVLSSSTSGSSECGVGRWNLGAKNAVVFHDINIATLVGPDLEKVKSLTRSENCIAKVHSSTITVSPVFLVYTSNERLFRHFIPGHLTGTGLSTYHRSELDEGSGKKKVSAENLEAIRARFLEMYCFRTPYQDPQDLEKAANFERSHFILGTFDRAMTLLEMYTPADFHSLHLPAYVLSALTKHLPWMENVMCESTCSLQHGQRLKDLQNKYQCFF